MKQTHCPRLPSIDSPEWGRMLGSAGDRTAMVEVDLGNAPAASVALRFADGSGTVVTKDAGLIESPHAAIATHTITARRMEMSPAPPGA